MMKRERIGAEDLLFYYAVSGNQTYISNTRIELYEQVDVDALAKALGLALKRHPKFRKTVVKEGNELYYEEVQQAPVVMTEDRQYKIGTDETNRYLFVVIGTGSTIFVRAHHGVADGKGNLAFVTTLLYYYFTGLGHTIDPEDIVLTNEKPADPTELEGTFEKYADPDAVPLKVYNFGEAYCIPEGVNDLSISKCHDFKLTCSIKEILKVSKKYETSPVPLMAMLVSKAIRETYDASGKTLIGLIPVNMRPYFKSNSVGNFSGSVPMPYDDKIAAKDPEVQTTIMRTILDIQAQKTSYAKTMAEFCEMINGIRVMPGDPADKQRMVTAQMKENSRKTSTYSLSYVGKTNIPEDMKKYIKDIYKYNPAYLLPVTINATEYNGILILMISLGFEGQTLMNNLLNEFKQYDSGAQLTDLGFTSYDKFLLDEI